MISQREAHRLRKRVEELEQHERQRNRRWCDEYPGGVHIGSEQLTVENYSAVDTARRLGHAVVIVPTGKDRYAYLYGIKL